MDREPAQDLNAAPPPDVAPIELTRDDLAYCQDCARNGETVTLHFTNWPGTPSIPVAVLNPAHPDGNVMITATGLKLFAMPDELSTVPRAGLEQRHAPGRDRTFTMARMRQGFRDQAHLDAFYAYYDHVQAGRAAGPGGCGCGQPGKGYDGADGWQPTETVCDEGRRLAAAS